MRKPTQKYLLMCLAEECNEVGKMASKIYRFGQNDIQPGHKIKNRDRLALEIGDILGVVDMLKRTGLKIDECWVNFARKEKPKRIQIYLKRRRKP